MNYSGNFQPIVDKITNFVYQFPLLRSALSSQVQFSPLSRQSRVNAQSFNGRVILQTSFVRLRSIKKSLDDNVKSNQESLSIMKID